MKDILIILLAIVVVIVVIMALTDKGRFMLKAMYNSLFFDAAKTPKGAEKIYQQAIEEAKEKFSKASDNLMKVAGLLNKAETELKNSLKSQEEIKSNMEYYAKLKQFDKVDLYGEELFSIEESIVLYKEQVQKYSLMKKEAETLANMFEQQLSKLKREKQATIRQLEMNIQTKEMYDDLDELKSTKGSQKMLDAVKEGLSETSDVAAGARIVHNSKHSTKIQQANMESRKHSSSSYAEELKKKYNK